MPILYVFIAMLVEPSNGFTWWTFFWLPGAQKTPFYCLGPGKKWYCTPEKKGGNFGLWGVQLVGLKDQSVF